MSDTLTRHGRFVDEPLPNLCDWVAHPGTPSPAGGTVIACCGALLSSLSELVLRVTRASLHKQGYAPEEFDHLIAEVNILRRRLLDYGEGDVYEAQKIIQGRRDDCVRKDVGSPAKITGTIVKLLRFMDQAAPHVKRSVHSDLRVVAYLAHGAVYGITEIAYANIRLAGGADDALLERIERWRQEATDYRDRILSRT